MKYKKFLKKIHGDDVGYESATPEIVADFISNDISKRLRDLGIREINAIDCCCGIGSVAIALSKRFNLVMAVDKDKERLKTAKENAGVHKQENINFICEDIFALNFKNLKAKYGINVVFADPQRRLMTDGEFKRVSDLAETSPNTTDLINFISVEISNMCVLASSNAKIEIPSCERVYISWEGRKGKRENLLALYFGNLKRCDTRAVVLPCGEMICRKEKNDNDNVCGEVCSNLNSNINKYLYEIRDCVVKAGLLNELINESAKANECKIYPFFNQKFLTSEKNIKSSFFENRFEILAITDKENLIENLKKFNAGKIVIRGKISPEKYKKMKNETETVLAKFNGKEKIHIFLHDKSEGYKILIGKNLNFKV